MSEFIVLRLHCMLYYCDVVRTIIWHHKNLDTIGKQNYQEPGVETELNFEFFEFYCYIF